jgi:hypothetical protein
MIILCPTEEDSGMLTSSVFAVFTCVAGQGEKGSIGGWVRGLKMGQLTVSMGPARAEVHSYVQRATFPSKGLLLILNIQKHHTSPVHAIIHSLLCRLKIHHMMEKWNMRLYLA